MTPIHLYIAKEEEVLRMQVFRYTTSQKTYEIKLTKLTLPLLSTLLAGKVQLEEPNSITFSTKESSKFKFLEMMSVPSPQDGLMWCGCDLRICSNQFEWRWRGTRESLAKLMTQGLDFNYTVRVGVGEIAAFVSDVGTVLVKVLAVESGPDYGSPRTSVKIKYSVRA